MPVLNHIGEADLTAHVEFNALKIAVQENVDVYGPLHRDHFLIAWVSENAPPLGGITGRSLSRLTAPDQMENYSRLWFLVTVLQETGGALMLKIQSAILPQDSIAHGFFGRQGGASTAI